MSDAGKHRLEQKQCEKSLRIGADNGARTRDTKLGKLVLYQLSYVRTKTTAIQYNGMTLLSRKQEHDR